MLQRNYEAMWRTKYAAESFKAGDKEKGWENLRRAGVLFATSALWPALVEEMVTPYTNSEHDSWGKWTGKTLLNGMSSTIPFVREIVHAWLNNFEVGGGIFDSGMHEIKSAADDLNQGAKMMDAEHGGKTIKALTSIVGMATGLPNEVGNVMKTAWDSMHRSKETPKNAAETFRDATTGRAVGQPDIPQRMIEAVGQKGRRK